MGWRKRSARVRGLAEGLLKVGALQFGAYSMPDGTMSSYYVNLRGMPSYPGVYKLVIDSMTELFSKEGGKTDAICGVPVSGLTIAAPLAVALGKPLVYTRTVRKEGEGVLEGEVRPNWKVAVVDDLATSGKTILASSRAVEEEGGITKDAFVLIDRMEGAREKLAKEGISLHAVTDIMELADTLHSLDMIDERSMKALTKSVGGR